MSSIDELRAHLSGLRTLVRGVAGGLSELSASDDPIRQFEEWYDDAERSGLLLPESVALATATRDGVPSVRMVLLKGVDERGFRFFTNYESRKATELDANPRAALCFHWSVLERQVRVEGSVERLPREESEEYFETRERGSQIGAWASRQSRPLDRRADLETRVRECEVEFLGRPVPLPEFWGGYRLRPDRIEFWQGRRNRLHDRLVYEPAGSGGWDVTRLYP
ncbi:MAG: pyridoxamine 5'-phosphate oxidase [Gemmatimonadota bacterium]|nr:pyridoxamine 5'-phosphate oxidase [Gemmatimonadota bacterium]